MNVVSILMKAVIWDLISSTKIVKVKPVFPSFADDPNNGLWYT